MNPRRYEDPQGLQSAAARAGEISAAGETPATETRLPARILIVSSRLHIGGAEQIVASLARNLDSRRYSIAACYLEENGLVGEQMAHAGVTPLPLPGHIAGQRDRLTALKLRSLIRGQRIELIHTHDVHGFVDGCLCRLSMPRLRHIHTFHFGNYPHRPARIRRLERLFWRVPDALVAVGNAQASAIRSLYGIPEMRLRVFWNGVDEPTARVSPAVSEAIRGSDGPVLASINTLIPQKALDVLIDAAAELSRRGVPFRLLIVGDGPLRNALEQRVKALGLGERVRFLGWIPEAAAQVMPACDVLVQSSLWEAMSVFVLEAMACGKPVVATRVGDNREMIVDGHTGLTVEPRDPWALASALETLLVNPSLRFAYGRAARERHARLYTTPHMIHRYEDLYEQVLHGDRRG